jgi:cell division protein FtsW
LPTYEETMMAAQATPRFSRTDWGIVFIVFMLLIFGLIMVYSSSYGYSLYKDGAYSGRPTYFVERQAKFALAGLVVMLIAWRIDYHLYRRLAVPILLGSVFILAGMAILGGSTDAGTGRWLLLEQRSVQPSELAKVGALIYMAVWLEAKAADIQSPDVKSISLGLIPFAVLIGVIAGLIVAQRDFSTAALLVVSTVTMFFVAGADIKQLLIGGAFGGPALVGAAFLAMYRKSRVTGWLQGPFADPMGQGYQLIQGLVALNNGGLFGLGLGQSQQKYLLPAAHTDFVFAISCEELGFVGGVFIIGLYAWWTWRGLRIARYASDQYGRLLAIGLVSWVTFQAALHIAVATNTTPLTGTVLPFISYGGSSLVTLLGSVGILLNISRHSRMTPGEHHT